MTACADCAISVLLGPMPDEVLLDGPERAALAALAGSGFISAPIPREALFLAGKAFLEYRRRGGVKAAPLPDFFIGAHAAVASLPLVTRDPARVRSAFPRVRIIDPR